MKALDVLCRRIEASQPKYQAIVDTAIKAISTFMSEIALEGLSEEEKKDNVKKLIVRTQALNKFLLELPQNVTEREHLISGTPYASVIVICRM